MKNKKGFTLIELLAVIVILAIIAVIATPIILGVVEDSRKSAAKASAYGALDAIRSYYATSQISDTAEALPLEIDFSDSTDVAKLKMSGTKPTAGIVTLTDTGTFTVLNGAAKTLTIGTTYKCTWNDTTQVFDSCAKV